MKEGYVRLVTHTVIDIDFTGHDHKNEKVKGNVKHIKEFIEKIELCNKFVIEIFYHIDNLEFPVYEEANFTFIKSESGINYYHVEFCNREDDDETTYELKEEYYSLDNIEEYLLEDHFEISDKFELIQILINRPEDLGLVMGIK
ncbi:hypothetical protein [Bacillus sp. 03113]|uniref:hypothetical protein n=1 Tax=Bacillus sp. 03113 TaxID=2578211 RepID=UPI0011433658|nr:hypothetical protein [Bacillus sp. 03113]